VKFSDGDKVRVVTVNHPSMEFALGKTGIFSDAEKPGAEGYWYVDFRTVGNDEVGWLVMHEDELEKVNDEI
jgi:hypothetical protein